MENVTQLINDFGFPIVMAVGMGYFVYFVYNTILNDVDPAIEEMKITIIRLIDQLRLLDQLLMIYFHQLICRRNNRSK